MMSIWRAELLRLLRSDSAVRGLVSEIVCTVIDESAVTPTTTVKWQPIATAPKDGRAMLLCKATDVDGRPIAGRTWHVFVQIGMWWEGDGWIVYCNRIAEPRLHFEPTHWAPLPAQPVTT